MSAYGESRGGVSPPRAPKTATLFDHLVGASGPHRMLPSPAPNPVLIQEILDQSIRAIPAF